MGKRMNMLSLRDAQRWNVVSAHHTALFISLLFHFSTIL